MKQTTFFYADGSRRVWNGPLPSPIPSTWIGPDFLNKEEIEVADPKPDIGFVWAEKLAGRITDPVTGISMEARERTRDILGMTLLLLTNAKQQGMLTGSAPYSLWDADGAEHKMTVDEAINYLLRYGLMWSAMYVEFAP
jgi:hypothetical protein